MNPVIKRYCSELHQQKIEEAPSYQQHSFSDPYFRQVPQAILRHNFVSYLSFHEQSLIMTKISKAFNELVDFAREEQDWKDHILDCRDFKNRTTVSILDNKYFFLKDYLRCQASKQSNRSINLLNNDPYIEILEKKIKFITRITFMYSEALQGRNVISTAHLSRALIGQTTGIRGICFFSLDFNLIDSLLSTISETCPKFTSLGILFSSDKSYGTYAYNCHNGLAQLLQKCENAKLNIYGLKNEADFSYLKKSVEQCVSLDPNFNLNLFRMEILSGLNLNDQWCSILQRSSSTLTIFETGFSEPNLKITENFIYELSYCTQLTSIKLQDREFESNIKYNVASQHDNAFAQVFKNCTRLKIFYYKNNLSLGDASFKNIISHPNLEELRISIVPTLQILEDPLLANSLHPSFSLKKIDLIILKNHVGPIQWDFSSKKIIENADTIVKLICKFCPNLEKFKISNQEALVMQEDNQLKFTDETSRALASLSRLRDLDLDFIKPLSPTNIMALANCSITELRFKLFSWDNFEDTPLVEKFNLEHFTISNCKYYYYKIKKNNDERINL